MEPFFHNHMYNTIILMGGIYGSMENYEGRPINQMSSFHYLVLPNMKAHRLLHGK